MRIKEFFSKTLGVIPAIRITGWTIAILFAVAVFVPFASVEVTSTPRFCGGTCHVMRPYYESWKHSPHAKVACVECHIPPGVKATIKKKYQALSMVASYFTGTYGTKPWAEVEDAACIKCHQPKAIARVASIEGVAFDHARHTGPLLQGMKLRCASCHSQVVQGSHIAVMASTCILCHFHNGDTDAPIAPAATAASSSSAMKSPPTLACQRCHTPPTKVYTVGTVRFDHSQVARYKMECRWCHSMPAGSRGEVPRERCVTCHNDPRQLVQYSDSKRLHREHLVEHKVECMDCHLHLEHVAPIAAPTAADRMRLVSSRIHQAATDCRGCHETGHAPQLALYTGSGGQGVAPMPSPMFVAGVRCEGCHQGTPGQVSEHGSPVNRASEASCMACHDPTYRRIFRGWKEGTARRTEVVRAQLAATEGAIGRGSSKLAQARFNLALVERGHGVHNVSYAYALLRQSHDDLNAARREKGIAPLPSPWREAPYASPCFSCHAGIEDQTGTIFGKRFAHDTHVISAKLECAACHRTHQEKPAGEVVRFGTEGCISCHHKPPVADCQSCHASILTKSVKSFRGDFDHKLHVEDAGKACTDCHDVSHGIASANKAVCAECHEEK